MGIRGLTAALKECGLLPNFSEETGELFSSLPRHVLQPGSTLAIDGAGFAFHVYRIAYFKHYKRIMDQRNNILDDFYLIQTLLPSMLQLNDIQTVAQTLIQNLLQTHGVSLHVFLDGRKQPRKTETSASRQDKRTMEESALRNLFQKQILPASFRSSSSKSRKANGQATRTIVIPDAHSFMAEFPVPTLLFEEVYHTFRIIQKQLECGDIAYINTGSNTNTNTIPPVSLVVTQCEGEADQSVAMISALDTNNLTFAVGQDSDYLVFGFPSHHEMWTMGDLHVQYLPLDSLTVDQDEASGYVITRKHLAEEFHLPEDLIVEATMLVGNDYTKFVLDRKMRKCINFYRDHYHGSGKGNTNGNRNLSISDIMEQVSDLGDDFYRVESEDTDQQLSIDFSRDLFHLQDVSHWLEEEGEVEESNNEDDDSASSRAMQDLRLEEDEDDIVGNYIRALDHTLMQQSEAFSETYCIKSQIMAPFEQLSYGDEDLENLLRETLNVMMSPQSPVYDNIPPGLSWNDYMLAEVFQKSIRAALKRRSVDVDGLDQDHVPSKIFDHLCFYHALAARNKSTQTRVNTMDGLEKSLGSLSVSEKPSNSESNNVRKALPIDAHKDMILASIQKNRCTIIQGETGCGKSSRVPVMLLEAPPPDPSSKKVKMFICQPRRIAAKSLTERVRTTEPHLKDSIGLRMGHGVREYETKNTRAWFVTTGYLVRYLANNIDAFHDVTHLVIDEVHERSIDSDIICLLAKRLLQTHPTIRLVLMSATVAAELYQDYFGVAEPPIFVGVRCHPIKEFFSEDIAKHLKLGPKERNSLSEITEKCMKMRCQAPPNANYIQKLHLLAFQIAIAVGKTGSSVLIFVPGMADIVAISEMFEVMVSSVIYTIIPIHSDIPFEDQMTAFDLTESNEVKVIIATNAAESSITLPDVDNVICFGLSKSITYNKVSHRQVLETAWISKANATQRAGRTGRVRPGNVFRLYPKQAFNTFFRAFEEGEILRSPLDSTILNLRTIVEGESISALLMECIERPDIVNIENSFKSLHNRNFITEASDEFAITSLGELVVALGIDLSIAALVGFGIRLGLLGETIELAAILSFPQTPWLIPNPMLQDPEVYNDIMSKTYVSKCKFDRNLYSETFSIMNVLFDFERSTNRQAFCRKHGLSYARVNRLALTRDNLRTRVASYLGKNASSLELQIPPYDMDKSKILALRILKTWMFHDGIVRLPPMKRAPTENGLYTMQLKGDAVDDRHLEQVLDHSRHKFTLKSEGYMIYNGRFSPVEVNYEPTELVPIEFEERLLSFSIQRNCNFVVSRMGSMTNLYISQNKRDSIIDWVDEVYNFRGLIQCTLKNAKAGGDCGVWSAQYTTASSDGSKTFVKYGITETDKKAKKSFKLLREIVRSEALVAGLSALLLDIGKTTGGPVNLYSYGINDFSISTPDFVQLFRTPDVKVQKSPGCSLRQSVIFEETLENGTNQSIVAENIPEGARILLAVAAGRRTNQVIRFKHGMNEMIEEGTADYLEVALGNKYNTSRWQWTETGEPALLDSDSIPATISPQPTVMYACAGNILELRGGRVRAEGITMLPGGEAFVNLAKECIGISSLSNYCDELEEHGFAAEAFYDYFNQSVAESDLRYFPDAVRLLCNVFHSLGELEMVPWLENEPENVVIDRFPSGPRSDKKRNKTLGADICKSLGDENVPSCFMSLFSEGQSKAPLATSKQGDKKADTHGKYKCLSCSLGPFKWGELRSHLASAHGRDPKQMGGRKLWLLDDKTSAQVKLVAKKNPRYQCYICQAGPFKWKAMKSHAASTHNIASEDMKKEQCCLPACANDAESEVDGLVSHQDTYSDSKSKAPSVQVKAAAKKTPKYQCHMCQAGPFKWKTMKSHAASTHNIASEDMKTEQWSFAACANDAESEVDGLLDTHQDIINIDSKSKAPSVQVKAAAKKTPKYQCHICQAGPYKWKTMKSHAVSTHNIASEDMKTEQWSFAARANDAEPNLVKAKGKKNWKARFGCLACNVGPFRWEQLTKHTETNHGIELSPCDMHTWLMEGVLTRSITHEAKEAN